MVEAVSHSLVEFTESFNNATEEQMFLDFFGRPAEVWFFGNNLFPDGPCIIVFVHRIHYMTLVPNDNDSGKGRKDLTLLAKTCQIPAEKQVNFATFQHSCVITYNGVIP